MKISILFGRKRWNPETPQHNIHGVCDTTKHFMAQNEPVKCDLFLENQWMPRYWNKQKVHEAVITTMFNKV